MDSAWEWYSKHFSGLEDICYFQNLMFYNRILCSQFGENISLYIQKQSTWTNKKFSHEFFKVTLISSKNATKVKNKFIKMKMRNKKIWYTIMNNSTRN